MGTIIRGFTTPADFTFYMNRFFEFRVANMPEDFKFELQQVFFEQEPGGMFRFTYLAHGPANTLFVEAYVPENEMKDVKRALTETGYILNTGACSVSEIRG